MTLFVGTSGWQYQDWRGVFYPEGCPTRLWLEEYAAGFATVEINNAFYRLPTRENFEAWRDRVPRDFVVAVKASRYLTHIKRLRDPEEPVHRLMSHAQGLGDRLGPILLQLPPTLRADADLLNTCLGCFPSGTRIAVEPRHDSWWAPEIREVLESHGAALCWADTRSRPATPSGAPPTGPTSASTRAGPTPGPTTAAGPCRPGPPESPTPGPLPPMYTCTSTTTPTRRPCRTRPPSRGRREERAYGRHGHRNGRREPEHRLVRRDTRANLSTASGPRRLSNASAPTTARAGWAHSSQLDPFRRSGARSRRRMWAVRTGAHPDSAFYTAYAARRASRAAARASASLNPSRRTRSAYTAAAPAASRSAADPAAATNVPLRPRVSITPSVSSARYALATVLAASPSCSASPRTVGSRYPTGSAPEWACSEIWARTCS